MPGNKDKNMEHPVLLEACDLSLQRGSFHLKDIFFRFIPMKYWLSSEKMVPVKLFCWRA